MSKISETQGECFDATRTIRRGGVFKRPLMQEGKLVVLYCLHKGCNHTAYAGIMKWEISVARLQHIEDGEPSMFAPYCPRHNPDNKIRRSHGNL